MASELDVLLDTADDPTLRADLTRQVALLRSKRRFGLVFEEHVPERVVLPEHMVRRGTRVVPRDHEHDEPREVVKVARGKATGRAVSGRRAVAGGTSPPGRAHGTTTIPRAIDAAKQVAAKQFETFDRLLDIASRSGSDTLPLVPDERPHSQPRPRSYGRAAPSPTITIHRVPTCSPSSMT